MRRIAKQQLQSSINTNTEYTFSTPNLQTDGPTISANPSLTNITSVGVSTAYNLGEKNIIYNSAIDPGINCRVIASLSTSTNTQDGMFIGCGGNGSDHDLRLCAGGTNNQEVRLFIKASSGKIGIGLGETAPKYQLDISGDVNASENSVYRINGINLSGSGVNDSAGVTINTEIDHKQDTTSIAADNGLDFTSDNLKIDINDCVAQSNIIGTDLVILQNANGTSKKLLVHSY